MLVNEQLMGEAVRCIVCGKEISVGIEQHHSEKFYFILCRECAQHMMRTLLEDIIAYDNGVHVSLLNVMYHARKPDGEMKFRELKHVVRKV